ncbi:glycosyltransferase family 4 protein [uncultured Pseudoteredinibacter sp.]|uniref:glycosyltransferase family 4 protein n=1 Tax=uncultured Pseudoteredinibacter sp. TaxID=1641701 RepID=UPI00263120E5|nr:glycosyltransferase family 4 protein [uncultured Pseudoteredinibacter sp.]
MNSFSQNIADSNANNRADTDAQRSLRICLLGYRSAPFVGGQGIYIKYLSKALVDAGHQVDVISGPPYPDLDPRVKLIQMPSLDLFSAPNHVTALRPKHLKSFSDTFEWWSMLTGGFAEPYTFSRRAAKYLKIHGHRYDLVHDNQCLGWGLLSIQKRGLPVVATVHHPITRDRQLALNAAQGWKDRLLVKRWHSFLRMQKRVVQKLNHIVTVSEQSRHDIADAFDISSDGISLVYNGIDTETFRPRSDVEKQPLQLITTASADQPLKGLRYLLDAMANLRENFPELQLLVVGKLREDGDTAKQLKKLKLEQQVRFVSGISTEELVQHYNASSIAVSPSLYEGFGLPAGEAMACGTAVISSDGGALPEIVGDVGVVVPAGNAEALSKAIAELLQDPERRKEMGLRCRERIEEKFSWKVAAEQFGQYYQQMLAERK